MRANIRQLTPVNFASGNTQSVYAPNGCGLSTVLGTLVLIFAFQAENILSNPACVAAPGPLIGANSFFELAVATVIALYGPGSGAALATVVGVLDEVSVIPATASSTSTG